MSGGAFLEVRGLVRRFGGVAALDGVDLDVGADELLVVLGPTGAGKTTLLRALAGLEPPDAGSVRMGGRDVTAASPADRDVALVFQDFSLYPDWSVRRNLGFPLRAPGRRLPPAEIDARVAETAEVLRLTPLLDKRSTHLSGGEMQRVAIGRALVRRPRLFLMDEPLTNLDAKLRESLRTEIVRLRRELGTPMVYVTHDQAEALSMGDAVVVLHEGRVLQRGTPEEVYARPASPRVARQVGQPAINLVEAVRDEGGWRCATSGAVVFDATAAGAVRQVGAAQGAGGAAAAPPPAARAPRRATLGLRPEDVRLVEGEAAEVLLVEDMGAVRVLRLAWHGHQLHALTARTDLAPGARADLAFDPARAVAWSRPGA